MREYTVREYDATDIELLENMSKEEVVSVLEGIKRGWLPQNYICGTFEGKTYSEDEYNATKLHAAMRLAIKELSEATKLPSKQLYIFYSKGTNHDGTDDVAITEATSLDEAIICFRKAYSNASEENVQLIDCNRDGFAKGIMIVSSY